MDNVASTHNPEFGYINCLVQTEHMSSLNNKNTQTMEVPPLQMAIGTECGLFFSNMQGVEMSITDEVYFKGQQISQVKQLSPGLILVAVYGHSALYILDRQNKKHQIKIEHPHSNLVSGPSLLNCSDIL